MSKFKEHIDREFEVSLPLWIDKSSLVLKAIKEAALSKVASIISQYNEESDFLSSNKAKADKQDDYSLRFSEQQVATRFKDKFRYLFRRGARISLAELQDILNSSDPTQLTSETELSSGFNLNNASNIRVTDSNSIMSGWIADITFPSIDSDNTPNAQDKNDFIFSEECFLLVEVANHSDFSNEELKEILLHDYLPFAIPSIVKFNLSL